MGVAFGDRGGCAAEETESKERDREEEESVCHGVFWRGREKKR